MKSPDSHVTDLAFRGLCATCLEGAQCVLADRGPVHHCDAFRTAEAPKRPARRPAARRSAAPKASTVPGLCVNCEERASCSLPGRALGVYHCEMYA